MTAKRGGRRCDEKGNIIALGLPVDFDSDGFASGHFGDQKTEVIEDIEVKTNKNDDVKSVTFEADSFSVYGVLAYTVDFTFDGYTYSIEGDSTIRLSKLVETLGIAGKGKDYKTGMELESDETADIRFETDSFSVYGVITTPGAQMDALNGRTATISLNDQYLTTNTTDIAGNPTQIVKSNNATKAASWMFESDGNGAYFISTMVGGMKKYMNITAYSGSSNSANLTITDTPQVLMISQNGNSYRISASINGTTYYVNHWNNGYGAGFACWHQADNNTNLIFTFPTEVTNNRYAVVM